MLNKGVNTMGVIGKVVVAKKVKGNREEKKEDK